MLAMKAWFHKAIEKKTIREKKNLRMTIKNISLRMQATEHKTLYTKWNVFQATVYTAAYFDLGHVSFKYYSSK